MALIKCIACGAVISDKAKACVKCGCLMNEIKAGKIDKKQNNTLNINTFDDTNNNTEETFTDERDL